MIYLLGNRRGGKSELSPHAINFDTVIEIFPLGSTQTFLVKCTVFQFSSLLLFSSGRWAKRAAYTGSKNPVPCSVHCNLTCLSQRERPVWVSPWTRCLLRWASTTAHFWSWSLLRLYLWSIFPPLNWLGLSCIPSWYDTLVLEGSAVYLEHLLYSPSTALLTLLHSDRHSWITCHTPQHNTMERPQILNYTYIFL